MTTTVSHLNILPVSFDGALSKLFAKVIAQAEAGLIRHSILVTLRPVSIVSW